MTRARAFAPASVANIAVGFDVLGFSLDVAGDTVTVEKIPTPEVRLEASSGPAMKLPTDPLRNTATAGLVRLMHDLKLDFGFLVSIEKGIPFGSGMGGSAASAVAGVVAANALLPTPLSIEKLTSYALIGEAEASGSFHADNVAPSLYGGLTLSRIGKVQQTRDLPEAQVTRLHVPQELVCVLIHPSLSIETKAARGILKTDISLKAHIEQSANLAGFIAGCYENDLELIAASLKDVIVEPQRAHLIPGFYDVQRAAIEAGALGCSISGAGPSLFAWARGKSSAEKIQRTMLDQFHGHGLEARGWTAEIGRGARLVP